MTDDATRMDFDADAPDTIEGRPMHHEKVRSCLLCGDKFNSAWAGERVCGRCRSTSKWRQG